MNRGQKKRAASPVGTRPQSRLPARRERRAERHYIALVAFSTAVVAFSAVALTAAAALSAVAFTSATASAAVALMSAIASFVTSVSFATAGCSLEQAPRASVATAASERTTIFFMG